MRLFQQSSVVSLVTLLCLQTLAVSQVAPPQSIANAKVEAILDDVLRRGEGHAEGQPDVKTYTWVPPSKEDLHRLREMGHDAIEPLNRALDPPYARPFQRILAIRLLSEIGGVDVLPPLTKALKPDNPSSVRIAALAALISVPKEQALPILQQSVKDPDPVVARRAKDLLTGYYEVDVRE
jgi:hypothetical protein